MSARADWVVLGIGNPERRDDGAGAAAAEAIEAAALPGVRVLRGPGDPAWLLDAWSGARAAYVVDAVEGGEAPGRVIRWDAGAGALPAAFGRGSTHALGLAEAVELARALGRLPERLVVYGVVGAAFGHGRGMSAAVSRGAAEAAAAIRAEIGALRAPAGETSHA